MPRIYVADLAAYNAGSLVGRWFYPEDFNYDADDLAGAVQKMLAKVGHEEWAIHDFEGFEGLSISEWESLDRVCVLAKAIDEYGEPLALFVSHFGVDTADVDDLVSQFEEAYLGETTAEDYAYQLVEDCYLPELSGASKDFFERYFDYEKFANDLVLGSDVTELHGEGATYLFNGAW